jgi:DNA processing protein
VGRWAYRKEHARLQERLYREHLLVSPFAVGARTARWHFPARNRVMAGLARATVLVEAEETSGTRHQVEACIALRRPVYARRPPLERVAWLRGMSGVIAWDGAKDLCNAVVAG